MVQKTIQARVPIETIDLVEQFDGKNRTDKFRELNEFLYKIIFNTK